MNKVVYRGIEIVRLDMNNRDCIEEDIPEIGVYDINGNPRIKGLVIHEYYFGKVKIGSRTPLNHAKNYIDVRIAEITRHRIKL